MKSTNYLVIPDLHIPYENEKALEFCYALKKEYKVKDENCYSLGDEVELSMMSMHGWDPNSIHTPNQELQEIHDTLAVWGDHFPKLKLCYSNHASRYWRKTAKAEIPISALKRYRDFIQAPEGWRWEDHWIVNGEHSFCLVHGDGYSGPGGTRQMTLNNGISTMHGHFHSNAVILWIVTMGQNIWGSNSGCLIDPKSKIYDYAKHARFKPSLGASIIMDDGRYPIWHPL